MVNRRARDEQVPPPGTSAAVHELLRDAAAPARPEELAGMSQAVSWFAAHNPAAPRRSRMPAFLASLLAAKTAMGASAAAAAGGLTLAAAAGALPPSLQQVAHDTVGAPAPETTSETLAPADTEQSPAPAEVSPSPSTDGDVEVVEPTDGPTPSVKGLCNAYSKGNKQTRGKSLESPAFAYLITAAGGKDGVAEFCATVLAAKQAEKDAEGDTDEAKPAKSPKPEKSQKSPKPSTSPKAEKPDDAGKPSGAGRS